MASDIVVAQDPVEDALEAARRKIDQIKVAMVKIYYIFIKPDIQTGLKDLPEGVKKLLKDGVKIVVDAIGKIVEGMTDVYKKGYVVIALLKELPNIVAATEELLAEGTAREAKRIAAIAAFTAVFVEEKYADVQNMLDLFAQLLRSLTGSHDKEFDAAGKLGVTAAQLGFDPKTGPALPEKKALPEAAPAKSRGEMDAATRGRGARRRRFFVSVIARGLRNVGSLAAASDPGSALSWGAPPGIDPRREPSCQSRGTSTIWRPGRNCVRGVRRWPARLSFVDSRCTIRTVGSDPSLLRACAWNREVRCAAARNSAARRRSC